METGMQNKKIHFTQDDDLLLLRVVLGQNPYEVPGRWNLIQVNIFQITGKNISVRTLKERTRNLVNKFLSKDKKNQFKSGIEEEISEFDDLLRHIADLMKEFANKRVTSRPQEASSYQKAFLIREGACSTSSVKSAVEMGSHDQGTTKLEPLVYPEWGVEVEIEEVKSVGDTENTFDKGSILEQNKNKATKRTISERKILTPTRKRISNGGIKQTTLNYLMKKHEKTVEIRSRELALQERAQTLQEQKFELETLERKKKIEMEEKKLNMELEIFKNQQNLIQIIFKKFDV